MQRRTLSLVLLLVAAALPLSASQFIDVPFDEVARGSRYIVRAHVIDTYAAWDESREVIYTYATLRVTRYFGETTGPDTLVVREVGGTIDGYTQEAVGFPEIRRGEQVVLMLAADGADLRIHAYNQGKFLVRQRAGAEVLIADPVKQGDVRTERPRFSMAVDAIGDDVPALTMNEFASMVDDARAGLPLDRTPLRQQQ